MTRIGVVFRLLLLGLCGLVLVPWQMLALRRFVSVLWLHRLRQPTLVLTGESDPIIPVANGRVLAGRIPGARLEVVPGGHLFILTHPGRTAARVNSFLDDPAL